MTLLRKLLATIHTLYNQLTCNHGPWLRDPFSLLPDQSLSAHCKQCWKVAPQYEVYWRYETLAEYVERAVKAGGSKEEAEKTWLSLTLTSPIAPAKPVLILKTRKSIMREKDRWDYAAEAALTYLITVEQADPQRAFNRLAELLRESYEEGRRVGKEES